MLNLQNKHTFATRNIFRQYLSEKWYVHALTIVIVLHCSYLFVMGMTGQLFSLDHADYGSGEFPFISQIIIFLCMLYVPAFVMLKGKELGKTALVAVCSYVVFPMIAEVLGVMQDTAETYTLVAASLSVLFMFVMLQNNIVEEIITEHKLAMMLARVDALTGIGNRYVGADAINERIQGKRPFVMMVMDVDKFKYINDTYGHPVGDLALKAVVNVLKEFFSEGVPVRMGGDEYMVILDGQHKKEELDQLIQKLYDRIGNIKLEGMSADHPIHVSVGMAMFDGCNDYSFDDLYHISDQRLYESKKHTGSYCTGEV